MVDLINLTDTDGIVKAQSGLGYNNNRISVSQSPTEGNQAFVSVKEME